MLIVQATRNLSSVTLLVGAGIKGRRNSGRGGGLGIRMVRGEGNKGAKKMLDVRRGWWVGLWGGRGGGNGLVSEKRRGAGPVCSAFEGGRWVVESVDKGKGRTKWWAVLRGGRAERGGRVLPSVGVYRHGWGGVRVGSRACLELWKGGVPVGAVLLVQVLVSAWAARPMVMDLVNGKLEVGRERR